jgi:molecular chaperone GrpE (heat shock protein)
MGVSGVKRGELVEQQAGAGVQEVPVRGLMKIVSEGVGELVESHKAKNAVGMLKDLISTSEPSPLSGLKELKEIGLDFGTITGVHKEVAEVYRNMTQEEREARKEAQAVAEKYKQEADQARSEVTRLQIETLIKSFESQIAELKKALNGGERKNDDPITRSLQEVAAEMVKTNLSQVLYPQQRKSPEEEILEKLTFADKLREYFNARQNGDDNRRTALVNDLRTHGSLEVLKLILEDEREREHQRAMRELEEKRIGAISKGAQSFKDIIGDLLRAITEMGPILKAQQAQRSQEQVAQVTPQPQHAEGVSNDGKRQSLEL